MNLSSCALTLDKTDNNKIPECSINSLLDSTQTFLVQQELNHVLVVQRRGHMERRHSKLIRLEEVWAPVQEEPHHIHIPRPGDLNKHTPEFTKRFIYTFITQARQIKLFIVFLSSLSLNVQTKENVRNPRNHQWLYSGDIFKIWFTQISKRLCVWCFSCAVFIKQTHQAGVTVWFRF